MTRSLDELFLAETSTDSDGVTGVGLLMVNRSAKSPTEKYFGRRSAITQDKINEDSAFWIYSITKTITAIAALQCVQRGEIELDDEVYDILPELRDFEIIHTEPDGALSTTPHRTGITLRHLLSHTSGIGVDVFDPRLQAWRISRGEHPQAFSGDSKKAYTIPLLFEPGQGWAYGGGVEWAGILIERLHNVKLGEYMGKHIFEPLGMTSTTFHPDQNPHIMINLVQTSTRISDGTLVPMEGPYPAVTQDDSGAMGLVSTLRDMARLTTDLLQDEPTILKKRWVDELFHPQFGPETASAGMLGYGAVGHVRTPIGEDYDPHKVGQVLGAYYIKKDTKVLPGGTLVMTGIPNLIWFVNRELGIGGLYASAIMPPDDAKSAELSVAFLKEVFHSQ